MTPNCTGDCSAYRVSTWVNEDGLSGGQYAVFRRDQAEKILGCKLSKDNLRGIAWLLTGWSLYYCGPGKTFGREPCVRVYKHAVLVYQRTGVDV